MNKEQEAQAKKTFEVLGILLKNEDLTPEKRKELEQSRAQLAGLLMSSWLPSDWIRKGLMFVVFLVGLYGIFEISVYFWLLLLFLLLFSPRVIGYAAVFIGRLLGNK